MESSNIIARDEKEQRADFVLKWEKLREERWGILAHKAFIDLQDNVENHPPWILVQKLLNKFLHLGVGLAGIEKVCGLLCDEDLQTVLSRGAKWVDPLPIHNACMYSSSNVVTFLARNCPYSLQVWCHCHPYGLPLDIVRKKMPMDTLKTLVTLNPSAVSLQDAIDKKYAWRLLGHIASLTPHYGSVAMKLDPWGLNHQKMHIFLNRVIPKLSELSLELVDFDIDGLTSFLTVIRRNNSVSKLNLKLPKMPRLTTKKGMTLLETFMRMFEENTSIQSLSIYGFKNDLAEWFPALQQSLKRNTGLRELRIHDRWVDIHFKLFAPPPTDDHLDPAHFMTRIQSLEIRNVHNFNETFNVFFQEILESCDCLESLRFVAVTGYDAATFGRALANADVSFNRSIELLSSVVSFSTFKTLGFASREPTTIQFGFLRENPGLWCQSANTATLPSLESLTI